LLEFERDAGDAGYRRVAGLDEAGRGPWAGPVVAACVTLPPDDGRGRPELDGLTDSKRLSPARRDHFFSILRSLPGIAIGVGWASAEEIDRLNILRATHRAMARALSAIRPTPDFVLVDGLPVPGLPLPSRAIVRGDSLSLSIAAASVVAKVIRDHRMQALDRRHPGYGFAAHKGYGTAIHRTALRQLGPCPIHRRSFRPVAEALVSSRTNATGARPDDPMPQGQASGFV
jgi:ribonuclease HII